MSKRARSLSIYITQYFTQSILLTHVKKQHKGFAQRQTQLERWVVSLKPFAENS